jgi:hypothetical protein
LSGLEDAKIKGGWHVEIDWMAFMGFYRIKVHIPKAVTTKIQ